MRKFAQKISLRAIANKKNIQNGQSENPYFIQLFTLSHFLGSLDLKSQHLTWQMRVIQRALRGVMDAQRSK
jgi:hypothetical protein